LKDLAYNSTGKPSELEFEKRLVGCTKWFDGTLLDVIKKVKGLE
jgi:citrate lyase alpha subunit